MRPVPLSVMDEESFLKDPGTALTSVKAGGYAGIIPDPGQPGNGVVIMPESLYRGLLAGAPARQAGIIGPDAGGGAGPIAGPVSGGISPERMEEMSRQLELGLRIIGKRSSLLAVLIGRDRPGFGG